MPSDSPRHSPLLSALGLDVESSLATEPRFLADPRLLAALHSELREAVGPHEAAVALLQMGFAHGLRDAARLVQDGLSASSGAAPAAPRAARIALELARPRDARSDEPLTLRGGWPERDEAEAVLSAGGRSEQPSCFVSAGYTSGWLSGVFAADVLVVETACGSCGDDACRFEARELAAWRESDLPQARPWLDAIPYDALRSRVAQDLAAEAPEAPSERFEPGSAAIHVWGPVMVIPFSGVEESLCALELIGSEPGARNVRVVVVDLTDAILDEGFGALALEQILAAIEGWGAEPLLAGASPLSQRVVDDLAHGPMLVSKDLAEAIATAFQIAQVQHRAL